MKLIRTNTPWAVGPVRFDDWFARAFGDLGGFSRLLDLPEGGDVFARSHLSADLFEDDHNYHVRVEIPGAKKEEVSAKLEDGVLHVAYQRPGGENTASISLTRAFRLPGPVAADQVTAKLEDGILTVTLPRHAEAKPRTITIE